MESIVNEQMKEFLESNKLISPKQHGFRSQRSTISQLLSHYEIIINGIQDKCNVDVIYLDFEKPLIRPILVLSYTDANKREFLEN